MVQLLRDWKKGFVSPVSLLILKTRSISLVIWYEEGYHFTFAPIGPLKMRGATLKIRCFAFVCC